MISFHFDEADAYIKKGVSNFILKYGLSAEINPRKPSKVCITYGDLNVVSDFTIRISHGEFGEKPVGAYKKDGLLVPAFGKPAEAKGQPMLYFSDGPEEYPFVSVSGNIINFNLDVFNLVGHVLSGSMEPVWGRLSDSNKQYVSQVPFADIYEKMLFDCCVYAFECLDVPFVTKSLWPDGKQFAVCLTHDVDEVRKTYQYMTHLLRHLKNANLVGVKGQISSLFGRLRGVEPYWTFDNILQIERGFGATSSLYFLKEEGVVEFANPSSWMLYARKYDFAEPMVSYLIKELDSNGWDVGLHGSFFSYKDFDLLSSQKASLETVLGRNVSGIRQHHLNLDIPSTWDMHAKLGFDYDTSLGFKDRAGFRWGTCFPFYPIAGLLEIPLAIMDTPYLYSTPDEWTECTKVVDSVRDVRGVLTLLWHTAVLNDFENPGWIDNYRQILRKCSSKNAWLANGKQISDWWHQRQACSILSYSASTWAVELTGDAVFVDVTVPSGKEVVSVSNGEILGVSGKTYLIKLADLKKNLKIKLGKEHA